MLAWSHLCDHLTGFWVGKYMLEKNEQDCERTYEFLRRIPKQILYVIVYRDSNEKQDSKAADNNVMDITTPVLHTTQRVMPMLEVERWSIR